MLKRLLPVLTPLILLVASTLLIVSDPPVLRKMRLAVFDAFLNAAPRPYNPELPVRIIDLDDTSLRELGQWPWPRTLVAEMIGKLTDAGAAAIALDIVFAETDRTSPQEIFPVWGKEELLELPEIAALPNHDDVLAQTIAQSNVITGFVLTESPGRSPKQKAGLAFSGDDPSPYLEAFTGTVTSLPGLEEAAAGNGALNSIPDEDGIIRQMPLLFRIGNSIYPGLSAEALRSAQGASSYLVTSTGAQNEANTGGQGGGVVNVKIGDIVIPTDATGKYWIHFTEFTPERYIPAWKVLSEDFDPASVEGMILLVGTSAPGLKDIRSTPLNPVASGVEVHAQAIEQALLGEFLNRPDWMQGLELLTMMAAGVILTILMARASAIAGAVFTLLALAAAGGGAWHAYTHYRLLVDPLSPGIAIVLVYLVESMRRYITTEREKDQVRKAFSHYMSPALVERLAENPEALKLGGEMREMTILFCDVRGFTTLSEQFDAEGLTHFLNKFLTPMTDVILSHDGTIDKYMGDAIMAFWNAPLDDALHAANACRASLEMMCRVVTLNDAREAEAKEQGIKFHPIMIGIGLNTGQCCVGNMGSDQRFDYSVLGDDVNLASRLEGQSKAYGVDIVIGEKTHALARDFATLEIDRLKVKGKTTAVTIYTLLGDEQMAQTPAFKTLYARFSSMLTAYRAQAFDEALKLGDQCRACAKEAGLTVDGLCAMYAERIADYKKTPPPADWDGVYVATSK